MELIEDVNTFDGKLDSKTIKESIEHLFEMERVRSEERERVKKGNLDHLYKKAEEFGEDVPVVLLAYCAGRQQPPLIPLKIRIEYRKWFKNDV